MRVVYLLLISLTFVACQKYHKNQGKVFGTSYNITYKSHQDLHVSIQHILLQVDSSLSTYKTYSTISRFNRNEPIAIDTHFIKVFKTSLEVYHKTDGYFDITVSPLVNAWGFGFKKGIIPTQENISLLLQKVGSDKLGFQNQTPLKKDTQVVITTSAIAKGYGVDAVADYLEKNGVTNYLVEIGGEIRLKGENPRQQAWQIGIVEPQYDPLGTNQNYIKKLFLNDIAVATSGNYRNYYLQDDQVVAHTINPKTGGQTVSNLLSVTVLHPSCMVADAYATAFMAMGLEKARKTAAQVPDLEIYLVYRDLQSNQMLLQRIP